MGYGFQVFKKRFFDAFLAIATDQIMLENRLESPIFVKTHNEQFVQGVSPKL